MPWIGRKALALQAQIHTQEVEAARLEERVAVLKHIGVIINEPSEEGNDQITAAKAVVAMLGRKLSDYWGLKNTAAILRKWGME
jgi:hypothetical protein